MKKLVAIALIAAMATVANAGIGFIAVGGTDVDRGAVVTINLVADGVANGFTIDAIGISGTAPVGEATLGTFHAGMTQLSPGYLENGAGILIDFIAAYATSAAVGANQILYSFTYTVPMTAEFGQTAVIDSLPLGEQFFSTLDGVFYPVSNAPTGDIGGQTQNIGGVTLNVIPEPMTLGLLGLGGLFLRRRLA